jgi:hypothetical protein
LDALGREIHHVLDLVIPMFETTGPKYDPKYDGPKYDGYCGAASEAYLHLKGGRASGLKVMRLGSTRSSHWWLEGPSGVIDLTIGPADRRWLRDQPGRQCYRYGRGEPTMFQNGYARPSKRAAAIIELVKSRRHS